MERFFMTKIKPPQEKGLSSTSEDWDSPFLPLFHLKTTESVHNKSNTSFVNFCTRLSA